MGKSQYIKSNLRNRRETYRSILGSKMNDLGVLVMPLPINFPSVIVIPIILQSGTAISSAFLRGGKTHKIQYSTFNMIPAFMPKFFCIRLLLVFNLSNVLIVLPFFDFKMHTLYVSIFCHRISALLFSNISFQNIRKTFLGMIKSCSSPSWHII